MTKNTLKRIALLLALASALFAFNVDCPIDGGSAMWTGKTMIDQATAKMLYQHKCLRGHVFWALTP
ncbi:MAG: hypothetical protein ABSE57_13275 [Bryobacteraceae bacterium]|jgi:hypothetical protein